MSKLKTEIVESRKFLIQKNKFFITIYLILSIAAISYIFFLQDYYRNIYLSISSFIIILYTLYVLVKISFIKPKTIGFIVFDENYLKFAYKEIQRRLDYSSIKCLKLIYTGYGSWSQYIWGNKNYLEIGSTDGSSFKFEFRIENKKQKNKLKKIFRSQPIKDQFKLDHLKNSRHQF